jgi:CCR4-NOT transcription complex subunit 3
LLKRIQEGRAQFADFYDKVQTTTNPSQKEKFEASLKTEIKKLQRFRQQLNNYITSTEIKDKNPMIQTRKAIEQVFRISLFCFMIIIRAFP